jgi:beta-lactam-binding protein with PASTA domain
VSVVKRVLSVFGKIGIIIAIAIAFLFGMAATVYLSLRSSEVKVPDVMGKDRMSAESLLSDAGLNMRVRATRPSADAKPDTVLFQLPSAGEVVKVGQTIAVDVTRSALAGESAPSTNVQKPSEADNGNENQNTNEAAQTNQNENQNKEKKNKNANNKNANNSNNANNANNSNNKNANNKNANNANNRNAQNGNVKPNSNTNANNKNTNSNNSNVNKRAPVISTPPFNPNTTPGTPR